MSERAPSAMEARLDQLFTGCLDLHHRVVDLEARNADLQARVAALEGQSSQLTSALGFVVESNPDHGMWFGEGTRFTLAYAVHWVDSRLRDFESFWGGTLRWVYDTFSHSIESRGRSSRQRSSEYRDEDMLTDAPFEPLALAESGEP